MLEVQDVSLSIDGATILSGVDLTLADHEICCVLGPSGSGKTSLLRVVAGLERRYTGSVRNDGNSMDHLDVQSRGFGLMFQDFALFPHLNVIDNVAFALTMRGQSVPQRHERSLQMLAAVGLETLAERSVSELSGGEKQRVALARSLIYAPRLLMLDEPLGSLDAALRLQLARDLRTRIKDAGLKALYVTHDHSEAFMIADRIVVMSGGQVIQSDEPRTLYFKPRSRFMCAFLGLNNVVAAEAVSLPAEWVCLHPAGFVLDDAGDWEGTVQSVTFEGEQSFLQVQWRDSLLGWRIRSDGLIPMVGSTVRFKVNPEHIVPLMA